MINSIAVHIWFQQWNAKIQFISLNFIMSPYCLLRPIIFIIYVFKNNNKDPFTSCTFYHIAKKGLFIILLILVTVILIIWAIWQLWPTMRMHAVVRHLLIFILPFIFGIHRTDTHLGTRRQTLDNWNENKTQSLAELDLNDHVCNKQGSGLGWSLWWVI